MQVFDEATQQWVDSNKCYPIVIQHLKDCIIYGYTSRPETLVKVLIWYEEAHYFKTDKSLFKGPLLFSKWTGMYFSPLNMPEDLILKHQYIKGAEGYPYILPRKYEAIENFDKFNNRQILKYKNTTYKASQYIKYTFGIEFETSQGYIPEDVCYESGLIPLRDGSISGPEYSTIVLKGNTGIALLNQQLDILQEYTDFNKECSLHVHLGEFPLNARKIFKLYRVCYLLEKELASILPPLTFNSSNYKANEKDYCKKLKFYSDFQLMYKYLTGQPFFGDFTQAHPNDITRSQKWKIPTRYFWCNFINLLCYNVNKTVEFRFLRPTYNFKKILLWLYIFNAILKYSENYYNKISGVSLTKIINTCYPEDLAKELNRGILCLKILVMNQSINNDNIGAETRKESELFNNLNI